MAGCPTAVSPERLTTLCREKVAFSLEPTIASFDKTRGLFELKAGLPFLPSAVIDDILDTYIKDGLRISDEIIYMLKDCSRARISRINLSNSLVSDDSLFHLSQHPIESLDVHNCSSITSKSLSYIGKMARTLKVLILGNTMETALSPSIQEDNCNNNNGYLREMFEELACADRLLVLSMRMTSKLNITITEHFLSCLTSLQHLDLSNSEILFRSQSDMGFLKCLKHLLHLSSLTLHNVITYGTDMHKYLASLTPLKSLIHLDLSAECPRRSQPPPSRSSQTAALQQLLTQLPKLTSLDLSCTHLARLPENSTRDAPIPALEGRQFQFLGLLRCDDNPSEQASLAAARVTGDSNIEQIIECMRMYRHRKSYLLYTFQSLNSLLKVKLVSLQCYPELLSITIDLLRMHQHDSELLQETSAAVYYLIYYPDNRQNADMEAHDNVPSQLLRKAIRILHNSIVQALENRNLTRNALITLYYLDIPRDVLFIYKSLSETLLEIIRSSDVEEDEFLIRLSLVFLNKMLRGDDANKELIGELRAIEVLCNLIRTLVCNESLDNLVNLSWTALWNITDETSANSEQFIGSGGISLFLNCYSTFCLVNVESERDMREELLRNMLGLLGNVAEVQSLRRHLHDPVLLAILQELLESADKGIEVNYHAAGIICNILSDDNGDQAIWSRKSTAPPSSQDDRTAMELPQAVSGTSETGEFALHMMDSSFEDSEHEESENTDVEQICVVNREEELKARSKVLTSLVEAMARWDTRSERCINYRSFAPILALLNCRHTVEVRQWACWALCNLTTVYPRRYSALLRDEGGIRMLRYLLNGPPNTEQPNTGDVCRLARLTLYNCCNELAPENTED